MERSTGRPGFATIMENTHKARRILLVEDEAIIALAEKHTIERYGYQVTTAATGEKALQLLAEGAPFDLVLMDIDLGAGISGTETARRILNGWTLPIVFLTSHSEREVVEAVKGITRYGYVLKSAGEFVLIEAITMAFELFEANRRAEENAEELDDFFTLALDLQAIADLEGNFRRVNPAWERLLGYSREEIEGEPFMRFVHPDDVDATLEVMLELAEGERTEGFVNRYRRADGAYRYIEWSSRPRGQLIYTAARDVTDRRLAEIEAERQRQLLEGVVEHANVGIALTDEAGIIVEWNRALEEITGLSRDRAVGRPAWELHCLLACPEENSSPEVRQRFEEMLQGGRLPEPVEEKITLESSGRRRHLFLTVFAIAGESGNCLASITQDLTRLIESERKYRLLAENSHDVILRLDSTLNTSYISPSIREITGYSPDWFARRSPLDIVATEDAEALLEQIRNDVRSLCRADTARLRMRTRDGRFVWVEARGRFEYTRKGKLASLLVNLREIDAQVEAEQELERRNAHVEFLIREVQHRIKNSMSTMVSLLSLQSRTVGKEARSALISAANRFRSMSELYDRLYRDVESGYLDVGDFLAPLVRQTVDQFPSSAAIDLEISCEAVRLDTGTLSNLAILVTELVTNSLKYAFRDRSHGRITFAVRAIGAGALSIRVGDDGVGIEEEERSEGFGMQLVRFLSEGLDATVERETREGTSYTILLPARMVARSSITH
ncbi:MAG: PAS domain S-box protein [Alkalispirochaetaceae bacterium]